MVRLDVSIRVEFDGDRPFIVFQFHDPIWLNLVLALSQLSVQIPAQQGSAPL